ncbi:hypothetical protein EX30DRAFT_337748 [Ascodesmis nigricans]|uniref:Uncharacterized protein n=1 Tax=Ascodesmis nigricans TaxID=341454 RepID=A0A4S2N7Y6_9PEZI|nr:hypothetical protein EX30DRAFT_337748 [Ascodesmis nigricans]
MSTDLLSDPALAPFLTPTFTPSAYLDSTLPPLQPPTSLPTSRPIPSTAVPLSTLSTRATTLLSTLDVSTQRLLAQLQTITDEILRIAPRLGYEVDLLRSDAVALAEELDAMRVDVPEPDGLTRLQMLSRVRERVEEVVKVFGDAMDWRLEGEGDGDGNGDGEGNGMKRGQNPEEEIGYLIASGEVEKARERVGRLRLLAGVFEGTVEGPARMAVVEALEKKVEAERRKKGGELEEVVEKREMKKKDDMGGYFGLISRLTN